jgi:type VI secretion system protein ImpL
MLKQYLPAILIGLSLLAGIGMLVYSWLRPEEDEEGEDYEGSDTLMMTAADGGGGKKDEFATTTEEYRGGARKSRMIALKESLEKSLDSREGLQVTHKNRMAMPWFLLVGADGSGKKTVLANNGLVLPFGPPLEVDSQRKDAGKWWLFEDAVVLEAPAAAPGATVGAQTLPPGQTVADTSVGWHTLLHMLRGERPDSPLNGIIVTISCADLLSARANPEKLTEQADRIRNFLERTRKTLGVRLPLHVIVTKCDTLPGFRTFADALPEGRRHDIFGWANPNDIETVFDPEWVGTGFLGLRAQLADLRDEVLAAPDQVKDAVGVFVFDTEFDDMKEPLKDFVSKLMTEGERRPSLYFRGMYFTGDAREPTVQATSEETQSETGARPTTQVTSEFADGGEAHSLVFLRSLFSEKIFKEAGLARPTAKFRLSRDRRVVVAQAAAILLLLGGSAGLWTAIYGWKRDNQVVRTGLRADAEVLTRVLSGLAIDLDELKQSNGSGNATEAVLNRRTRDAAVIELVGQMRDVPTTRVRSPFLPTSWFSPLPNDIRQSMMAGVQTIVLPVSRARLQERADRLLGFRNGVRDTSAANELDVSDPHSLVTYLNDVRTLSRNIARYNSLASPTSGSVAELSALLDYLFGEQISTDSGLATPDFEAALRSAKGPPIAVTPAMAASVLNRSVSMLATVASSAGRQLAPRTTPQAERAIRPEEDLQALFGLAALVDLLNKEHGLVATVSDSAILGVRLARAVQDSIETQLQLAAARIARDTLSPKDAADRLKTVIGNLFTYRLMVRSENRQITSEFRPNERLRWDVGRLELALALRGEFLQAVVAIADAFPGQSPDRMRRALEGQLRARALDVAASAQRFTPMVGAGDNSIEIRTESANLDGASSRLLRLAILFDSLKAGAEGKKLVAAGARQAEHALAMAQALVERQRYFAPQAAEIAKWQGVVPISLAALGVKDSLSFGSVLISHTTDMRTLAHDVAPALRYLRLKGVDTVRVPRLLTEWEDIGASVARYERGDFTSSLGLLHRYLRETMSMSDLVSCAAVAAQPDTTKPSAELFILRRRQFRAALVSRCVAGGSKDAVAAYGKLRALFASRLAGRFPFVDSLQAGRAADADVNSLREFFKQYDAFAVVNDVALRSDPTLTQTARGAASFLDQAAQVRSFMAPFVESGAERRLPEYSLLVHAGDEDLEQRWRYGDSVHVATLVDSLGNEKAVYVRGPWAPLRYARTKRDSTATIRFFHPDTKLELMLPVFPVVAPEVLVPRTR